MNKNPLTLLTILVAAGLLLSACTPAATSPDLAGSSWKLVSYGPAGNQTPAASGIPTSLTFGQDGQVSGNLGCNGFSGGYEMKGGTIVLGALASTLMACPEPQMTQEGIAFQVLAGTLPLELSGNTLTIHAASADLALTLARIENK